MNANSISQSELGRITGIKQATISDYVKGKSIPSAERFQLIASALGVSMDYLWGTSDIPQVSVNDAGSESEWKARALTAESRVRALHIELENLTKLASCPKPLVVFRNKVATKSALSPEIDNAINTKVGQIISSLGICDLDATGEVKVVTSSPEIAAATGIPLAEKAAGMRARRSSVRRPHKGGLDDLADGIKGTSMR